MKKEIIKAMFRFQSLDAILSALDVDFPAAKPLSHFHTSSDSMNGRMFVSFFEYYFHFECMTFIIMRRLQEAKL